jgi:hypothetical protein
MDKPILPGGPTVSTQTVNEVMHFLKWILIPLIAIITIIGLVLFYINLGELMSIRI